MDCFPNHDPHTNAPFDAPAGRPPGNLPLHQQVLSFHLALPLAGPLRPHLPPHGLVPESSGSPLEGTMPSPVVPFPSALSTASPLHLAHRSSGRSLLPQGSIRTPTAPCCKGVNSPPRASQGPDLTTIDNTTDLPISTSLQLQQPCDAPTNSCGTPHKPDGSAGWRSGKLRTGGSLHCMCNNPLPQGSV